MQDYEKLGVFYLGRPYDTTTSKTLPEPLLYESKDLTTHGLCVGMTGSGKTGLCLALLEEAAIDGIPALIIDPKGDLGNLLLAFPELRPADFQPWIDPQEAVRKGCSVEEYAKQTADTWKKGLADWDQPIERIARFRDAVDIAVYTPGSNNGLPLTIIRSFAVPPAAVLKNADSLRERVSAATAGLLALLGIDADPIRSREHILISNLFDRAWREGRDLSLGQLIREIQTPPFDKVGVLDLESFFGAKDRFALSMSLNNLLASPGFSAWMEGEPLDVQRLMFTKEGKPRLSILSLSHLSDSERMFFVTIFLNEVIAWMRAQTGTSSLRALLYMDEVFGYFPPSANPPSKTPMLTLLKQARAFGLGVMLATQNPVDLDYKGLANCGTWFIGRLQTERDKLRVLDGLEGASTAAGKGFDRQKTEAIISGLGKRVFLMNNVHDDAPTIFQTRWCLSYLRGPLSRDQISDLMSSRKAEIAAAGPVASGASVSGISEGQRPVLPPTIAELFQPVRGKVPSGAKLVYRGAIHGLAKVHFVSSTQGVDVGQSLSLTVELDGDLPADPWENAVVDLDGEPDVEKASEEGAGFGPLPSDVTIAKKFAALTTALKDHLYRTHRLQIWKCKALKEVSSVDESEADFRTRLGQRLREQRDLQVEKLRAKYAPKLQTLQDQIRRAEQKVEKEKSQAQQQTVTTILNIGTSVLGAMFGRKLGSAATVGKAASSIRDAGKIAGKKGDVAVAEENADVLRERGTKLEAELAAEIEELQAATDPSDLQLEEVSLQPKKTDISVTRVAILWLPGAMTEDGEWTKLG
jgi:hypothetical protein